MTTQVIINGFDYSEALVNSTGSFSGSNLNGLYIISNRLVLSATPKIAKPWSDLYNLDFSRGNTVKINFNGEPANIVGTTYILSAKFSRQDGLVTIETTCSLGLANSLTAEDLAICATAEVGVSAKEAIDLLLGAVGITNRNINISNDQKIYEPFTLGGGEGLIQVAATIARGSGYFLYQKKDGQVVSKSMLVDSISSFNSQIMRTERLDIDRESTTELPVTKLFVRGNKVEVEELVTSETLSVTTDQFKNITTTTIERDFGNRTITEIVDRQRGELLPDRLITTSFYESQTSPPQNLSIDKPEACLPRDEGRLIRRVTRSIKDSINILAPCINNHNESNAASAEVNSPLIVTQGSLLDFETVETWDYNTSETSIDRGQSTINLTTNITSNSIEANNTRLLGNDTVEYTKTTTRIRGVNSPIHCHWALGNNNILAGDVDGSIQPPGGLLDTVTTEIESIRWQKPRSDEWSGRRVIRRAEIDVNPSKFTSQANAAETAVALSFARDGMYNLRTVLEETRANWTPSDPGRMPPRFTTKETPYEREYTVTGFLNATTPKSRVLNLDIFGDPDTIAPIVARSNAYSSWGRYKGVRISSNFYSVEAPLDKVSVINTIDTFAPYNTETYYVDNPAISFDANNFSVSFLGAYLSSSNNAELVGVDASNKVLIGNQIYTFIIDATPLEDLNFISNNLYTDGTNFYFQGDTNLLKMNVEENTGFTPIATINIEFLQYNDLAQAVDASTNTLIVGGGANTEPITVTQLNDLNLDFTLINVGQQLSFERALSFSRFDVSKPATQASGNFSRDLSLTLNATVNVIGFENLVFYDEENQSAWAYPES